MKVPLHIGCTELFFRLLRQQLKSPFVYYDDLISCCIVYYLELLLEVFSVFLPRAILAMLLLDILFPCLKSFHQQF